MEVHPQVEKALKGYHPDLVIRYNPKWTRETNRFYICQVIRHMREIDERIGLFEEVAWEFPVLGVDQAMVVDRRWFEALSENRWDHNRKDPMDMVREDSARKWKMVKNMTNDWARDEGWWYWKKYAEQFSMGQMKKGDPTRKEKARLDRTGREALL